MPLTLHRRQTSAVAIILLAACCIVLSPVMWAGASSVPESTFPKVAVTNLQKARLELPQDFAGKLNLVIVSFAREQQKEVETWLPVARQVSSTHEGFQFYELHAMSRENPLYRWWFDASLRSDMSDGAMRAKVLVAYLNRHKFRQALHIPNEKGVVVLLVDRAGKVYWRAEGPSTDAAASSLRSMLAANGAATHETTGAAQAK